MVCSGCSYGRGDWECDLPNDYQGFMGNSSNNTITNHSGIGQYTVENFIKAFCYNDRFVGVQRIVPEDITHATREERYSGITVYYIVDTENDIIYGSYDQSEYEAECKELSIADIGEWIQTTRMPEGAYIDSMIYNEVYNTE